MQSVLYLHINHNENNQHFSYVEFRDVYLMQSVLYLQINHNENWSTNTNKEHSIKIRSILNVYLFTENCIEASDWREWAD